MSEWLEQYERQRERDLVDGIAKESRRWYHQFGSVAFGAWMALFNALIYWSLELPLPNGSDKFGYFWRMGMFTMIGYMFGKSNGRAWGRDLAIKVLRRRF